MAVLSAIPSAAAAENQLNGQVTSLLKQYCFDCHRGKEAEAGIDLDKLTAAGSLAAGFKQWQKVAAALEAKKMPPADAEQPGAGDRREVAALLRGELRRLIAQAADDPGPLVIRRLTSAEYAYTIRDLTGLDLNLANEFVDDAVGGEGFTNVGSAQFLHDATLERYLQAARRVAEHAVIGAGRLEFFHDPGKTGRELFAINRLNAIYRRYGFRTAAGEGGEPFGLDRYWKAIFAAWRYKHREPLSLENRSLSELAAEEGLAPQFAEHIWTVLNSPAPSFPTAEIVETWRSLPAPGDRNGGRGEAELAKVRAACQEIYGVLSQWQARLARAVGDEEEAAVLSEAALQVKPSHAFTARFAWLETPPTVRVELSVTSATGKPADSVVVWSNPRLRFRRRERRRDELMPLKNVLPAGQAAQLPFGQHPRGGTVEPGDLVTVGDRTWSFELTVPAGARGLEVQADVSLDLVHGESSVVRCAIIEQRGEKKPNSVSALLADPASEVFGTWKVGVLEFARLLPQVSHREPAPSDRDPIPPPFDNTYNTAERNFFHTRVKYYRDDSFFTQKMIDEPTRRALDAAWSDLLSSFEYHDIYLRFVAEKFQLDLEGRSVEKLDRAWIDSLPAEPRQYVVSLADNYATIQRSLAAAEAGHVADVLEFAKRAWRRPLTAEEEQRQRAFYDSLRGQAGLDHPAAVRALLVRVLVAPEFLYRAEPVGKADDADRREARPAGSVPLSNSQLASRLSYFLWSSLPDDELTAAAAEGKLSDPAELARQARRMLADAKARRLATEFFGQWFGFYQFDRYRGIDQGRFPEFNERLRTALYDEAVSFFEHIVRDDRPVNEVLFANYCVLNDELATHYGLTAGSKLAPGAPGPGLVPAVGESHPGGLLGLGAVLAVTSAPLRTSPVKRGDWLLRRVLGTPVPPPPANAGSIPADDALADGLTVRARLEAHRRDATCANCHARIDALGFALENYDPLGRWRESYRDGGRIETEGTLSDGARLVGPAGLREYLRQHQAEFHRTLATRLVGYALGRGEQLQDQRLIDDLVQSIAAGNDRFSDLVEKIVTSPQFRNRRIARENETERSDHARQ
jgi:hypothetical protein